MFIIVASFLMPIKAVLDYISLNTTQEKTFSNRNNYLKFFMFPQQMICEVASGFVLV